jgi:predicted nucleic acid-binding protein
MVVVSNSSPLIALQQIHRLDLLQELFHEILIPSAVAREAATSVAGIPWIRIQTLAGPVLPETQRSSLGQGEREAPTLAKELKADIVILDDDPARRIGFRLGLPVMGTVGILLLAKQRGLLPAVKPLLRDLIEADFFLSPQIYEMVLKGAGEDEP